MGFGACLVYSGTVPLVNKLYPEKAGILTSVAQSALGQSLEPVNGPETGSMLTNIWAWVVSFAAQRRVWLTKSQDSISTFFLKTDASDNARSIFLKSSIHKHNHRIFGTSTSVLFYALWMWFFSPYWVKHRKQNYFVKDYSYGCSAQLYKKRVCKVRFFSIHISLIDSTRNRSSLKKSINNNLARFRYHENF